MWESTWGCRLDVNSFNGQKQAKEENQSICHVDTLQTGYWYFPINVTLSVSTKYDIVCVSSILIIQGGRGLLEISSLLSCWQKLFAKPPSFDEWQETGVKWENEM